MLQILAAFVFKLKTRKATWNREAVLYEIAADTSHRVLRQFALQRNSSNLGNAQTAGTIPPTSRVVELCIERRIRCG